MARERDDYDDDLDDRPRRRRRDDALEPVGPMGPLDKMYRDTNIAVIILFSVCCNGIAFILSLICFLTAKDAKAKSNATVSLIISGIIAVLGIGLQVVGAVAGGAGGPGR